MRPSLLAETLPTLVNLRRPILIEGSPGLGKTQLPKQVAETLGYDAEAYPDCDFGFIHVHTPLMQPEDYGMPVVSKSHDTVSFVVPDKFPMEGSDHPEKGILLLDELPQADNAGQKILANLIQERELHGHKLMPGWAIVATGNRMADRAGANRILSHLRNKITTLEFEPSLDDWTNWAIDHDINENVISFLRFKPQLLNQFDPQREINPTPRAWSEGVSPFIDAIPAAAEFECFKGTVGEGPAAEFVGFLKIARKLPNPDTVLMDPKNAEVPTDPSTLYAIAGAIAHRATPDNIERVATYAKRLPPEFMVITLRDIAARDRKQNNKIARTKAYTSWLAKEGAKVLM